MFLKLKRKLKLPKSVMLRAAMLTGLAAVAVAVIRPVVQHALKEQTTEITVKLRDIESNIPLSNARLEIKSLGITRIADESGVVCLSMGSIESDEDYVISVSKEGYQPLHDTVQFRSGTENTVDMGLLKKPIQDY